MTSTGGTLAGNALIARTAADMWKTGGIRLYFKGLTAGLIGVFPYSAIDMSTFEGIKLAYTKWAGREPGIPGSLAFGALSGGIGATSVYPLFVVPRSICEQKLSDFLRAGISFELDFKLRERQRIRKNMRECEMPLRDAIGEKAGEDSTKVRSIIPLPFARRS